MSQTDREGTSIAPARRRTWRKRIFFLIILYIVLAGALEAGARLWSFRNRSESSVDGPENDCAALTFVCMGDSMTFGYGAYPIESYPMRLSTHFRRAKFDVPVKVYNLGIPGTNSSEGMGLVRKFTVEHPRAAVDYALIMYGVNNRWNLHDATIWEWDETFRNQNIMGFWSSKLQVSKFVKVATENQEAAVARLRDTAGITYHTELKKRGWDMFFASFNDEILARWVRTDLTALAELLRAHGTEPVFLTYHYPRFEGLNELIRETAAATGSTLLEMEKPFAYYQKRNLFHQDLFHFNAVGYDAFSRRVAAAILDTLGSEPLRRRVADKASREVCASGG